MAFDQEEIQNKDTPTEPVVKSLGTLIREYADSKTAPNLMRQIALGPDMLTEEKQSEQEALIIRFAAAAEEIYAGMDDSKVGKINVEGIYRMHPLRYVNCREWSARIAASAEKEAAAYRRALEKLNDADAAFLKVVPQIKSGKKTREEYANHAAIAHELGNWYLFPPGWAQTGSLQTSLNSFLMVRSWHFP